MATVETFGNIKRFGARYGRKLKLKYASIEKEQRKLHKCPYCNYIKASRLAVGIWQCKKCNSKFTGKAYSLIKKITLEEPDNKPREEATVKLSQ